MWRSRELAVAAFRFGGLVLCTEMLSGCGLYGCQLPGVTISDYIGQLGQSSASPGATEADAGVVTITLYESDAGGTLDQAMISVAKPGLRDFNDQSHVHDRQNGSTLLSSNYGYYRSDSVIFRSTAEKESGRRLWDTFKNGVEGGRAYFELHSVTAVDTAGISLVSRRHEPGRCT